MKLLFAALCLLLNGAPASLIIVDKDMKKPLKPASTYSTQDYMQRTFPIYTSDREAIIAAADKAAKWIEQTGSCYTIDTIQTAHTLFRVVTDCEGGLNVTVTLFTEVAETATSYSFRLVENETDKRKAQERLMDFATYINP
ncbi:MAG TPA: hypothetical protein VGN63_11050 [Flavisolibacter sp.]|jgi:hypothetical protein|nr:hypothetical protein [Flavisolibacter sp.]